MLRKDVVRLFSTGDVLKVSGLTARVFDSWCREGIVPAVNGSGPVGTGNHRVFALPTVVGVAVAAELRRGERGCVLSYVGKVVEAFASMTEGELLRAFKRGETHLAMVHQGKPILRRSSQETDWPDVREVYERSLQGNDC